MQLVSCHTHAIDEFIDKTGQRDFILIQELLKKWLSNRKRNIKGKNYISIVMLERAVKIWHFSCIPLYT